MASGGTFYSRCLFNGTSSHSSGHGFVSKLGWIRRQVGHLVLRFGLLLGDGWYFFGFLCGCCCAGVLLLVILNGRMWICGFGLDWRNVLGCMSKSLGLFSNGAGRIHQIMHTMNGSRVVFWILHAFQYPNGNDRETNQAADCSQPHAQCILFHGDDVSGDGLFGLPTEARFPYRPRRRCYCCWRAGRCCWCRTGGHHISRVCVCLCGVCVCVCVCVCVSNGHLVGKLAIGQTKVKCGLLVFYSSCVSSESSTSSSSSSVDAPSPSFPAFFIRSW
mmetsp:Transcript_16677/g.45830  ORF Transcript_16677/g.45830 Transcript_16677/m.45830 type:complete len:274 (-) Transcript_16677:713-1534(-)